MPVYPDRNSLIHTAAGSAWVQGAAADDLRGVWLPAGAGRAAHNQTGHKNETGSNAERAPVFDHAVFGNRWVCQSSSVDNNVKFIERFVHFMSLLLYIL